ncbi:MAG: hypothetical protein WBA39_13450 [Rivularia sp. (in: cyanobacteria)]
MGDCGLGMGKKRRGRWGDGEMGRWGDGEMGREGERDFFIGSETLPLHFQYL